MGCVQWWEWSPDPKKKDPEMIEACSTPLGPPPSGEHRKILVSDVLKSHRKQKEEKLPLIRWLKENETWEEGREASMREAAELAAKEAAIEAAKPPKRYAAVVEGGLQKNRTDHFMTG